MNVVRPAESAPSVGHAFATVFSMLSPQMAALDAFLHQQIAAFEPEIRSMADYCIDTSGKRIRPALVFLSGWRGPSVVSPDLVRVAAVVELVHLATLVHDDIMDGAEVRRNRRTAAKEFGSSTAVLLGDALFAHALHLAAQFPTTEVCAAVSASTRRVVSGEIVQTLRRGTTNISLADYHRIIDLKTAELFRVSCFLGARLAGSAPDYVDAVARFGRHLGIAYQIYDDLADYFGLEHKIGKTLGTDLVSGKLTLPLITLADRLGAAERLELTAEVVGERPPQLALRLRQMNELGVFGVVADAVRAELDAAIGALHGWAQEPPSPLLLSLGQLLESQVAALQPSQRPT
jgi:octaprenyl-diphosphate synthase